MKIFDMSERGIFMDITDVIVIGAQRKNYFK